MKGPVAVGVDLGGTWLRVLVLESSGSVLRSWRGRAPRIEDLPRVLRSLLIRWGLRPSRVRALVAGARGVWGVADRRREARRLAGVAARVRVVSDVEVAYLGALGRQPGVLLLAGTGSIALGRDGRGRWVRRGGLGPLLGDDGSAFWIGLEYLRRTVRGESGLRWVRAPDAVARIAGMAPRVLGRAARGDRQALAVVRRAQHHLAGLATDAAGPLGSKQPVLLSWGGGLLEHPWFRAGVLRAVRAMGTSVQVVSPRTSPVMASAHLALGGGQTGRIRPVGLRPLKRARPRQPPAPRRRGPRPRC